MKKGPHHKHYFDYAAATPADKAVERSMRPYFSEYFGNPGSLHSFGQKAIAAVDAARETVSKTLGTDFRDIIFTASATEANNLALRGIVKHVACRMSHVANFTPRIIVSAIEHESVLATARDLEKDGVEIVIVPVDKNGQVRPKNVARHLNDRTVLVSIMTVNNETGTIQPVAEISKIIRNFRESATRYLPAGRQACLLATRYPLLHTDAAQAFQFYDCSPAALGADMVTLSGQKIYGPKGVGALCLRQGISRQATRPATRNLATSDKARDKESRDKRQVVKNMDSFVSHVAFPMSPILTGGGQELGLRSGTENVPAIAGFAEAVRQIEKDKEFHAKRIGELRSSLWKGIQKIAPKTKLNAPLKKTAPHILNVYFPGVPAQELLTRLDLAGIAASSGSACSARSLVPSYVLTRMGYSKERATSSIRFSIGRPTKAKEIQQVLVVLKNIL